MEAADALIRWILPNIPLAMRAIRAIAVRGRAMNTGDRMRFAERLSEAIRERTDVMEGLAAFREECPTSRAGVASRSFVMHAVAKALVWVAIAVVVVLAVLLPVIIITGLFGGQPLAGTLALVGLVLLAFGVAWYVRHHSGMT
jgi:hypothetical protein